ncbi:MULTISPECIES: carboxymuconolactone decarboxylase family protein [Brucella/Ochrobactrum group]|uniref:Carboxymuconolactone decarboxylase family protein n=1 Tax=Ochrobactrum soli TaxID=2448455 RepID=A0A849KU78_9HYPH|nr:MULTISPECIES: carboxymuconolactone decarboxylase family protein [Brucella]RRD22479.1 carboxymuconolactone decarboxylase family protein [Brucellaceae bacterium VT-16-1752]WHT44654.1 carboxymuconolactone decarboxylase family protein [Ochrobactrum sp. SSR]NNU61054.1 carboxymuconolactone decarboxylase family protein [[Ochrobactrum] soli]RLL65159.1 carboxymuconolactone decarboxylase family protein [[Ochrobactrum] soli]WHS29861.1 carboxymuconolactone decarboxylase family protein [Brucella sp. NM4
MTDDVRLRLKEARARLGAFAKSAPELMSGFAKVSKTATAAGAFSSAQRELIAVSIAVVKGCEDCILYHVDAAIQHGATEQELVEALEVAVEMGGGPAVMYAGKALEAFRGLS